MDYTFMEQQSSIIKAVLNEKNDTHKAGPFIQIKIYVQRSTIHTLRRTYK